MGMIDGRPTPDYNCTLAELYAGLKQAWRSYTKHEAPFIAENTKYTAGLGATKKTAIEAAQALPDGQGRYAESEDMKVTMLEKHELALEKWNSLDGYIKKAFTGDHYKPRIEEAGKLNYTKALKKNWEVVGELMKSGKKFIADHSAVLIADGGMPPTFAAAFDLAKDDFDTVYADYMDARESAQEQTDEKQLANNAIYKDGREMMEDGKHIFRKSASIRERFIWEKILEMLTPVAIAGELVLEGDIGIGEIKDLVTGDITPTADTRVIVEVSGNVLDISAAPAAGPAMGAVIWTVAIGTQEKTFDEFAALVGADATNTFLKVRDNGPGGGHYKIRFTDLE